jgi:L-histidine N-alpha-methyltransferase
MDLVVNAAVHSSQFPERIKQDLLDSLRARDLKQKFHYETVKQAQQWLALHEAYSPARRDPGCVEIYAQAARESAGLMQENIVHVIGLGCGGGQKDTTVLSELRRSGKTVLYTPCDSSLQMVLVAQGHASRTLKGLQCQPLVCDLAGCSSLPAILKGFDPVGSERLITLFGVLHNFDPEDILPRIVNAVRSQDSLLISANLTPGKDYEAGLRTILPQYNNDLTREWLLTALLDLGIERNDGEMSVALVKSPAGLGRIEGRFDFRRQREIKVYGESFHFKRGESIRVFISDRYTPEIVRKTMNEFGLSVTREWIASSGEEGVFLCNRAA